MRDPYETHLDDLESGEGLELDDLVDSLLGHDEEDE